MFSAFNPSKCTHLEQWAADSAAPGEQSWTSCRSRDSNPQPWVTSGFKSNALSIRPTTAPCQDVKMSRRRRWSPGELLCLPPASDAHPSDAVSLDLPSDVARASLSGVPNSFYLPADRTHSSDERVKCPRRRLHGSSRPDTSLCPLISRG